MSESDVVITGLGAISSIGKNVGELWNGVINGISGANRVKSINDDGSKYSDAIAHEIVDFNPDDYKFIDKKFTGEFAQLGLVAAKESLDDAGLSQNSPVWDEYRIGTCFGSCEGGTKEIIHDLNNKDKFRLYISSQYLVNMAAGHISVEFNAKGPNLAPSTACTTGTHAIDLAAQELQNGRADVMIAGASEKATSKITIEGFKSIRAYSTRHNNRPKEACRPFDQERDGLVVGDGGAALILETREHAEARDADIYATVGGAGATGDGEHPISQPDDANGLTRAIEMAIDSSEIGRESIDYISAHATSTPGGDIHESLAINNVFGNECPYVTAMKSQLGHTLGAAGALEAILAIKSIEENIVPPTINLRNKDKECDVPVVDEPINQTITTVLSNSSGFGGTNSSIIFTDEE